MSLVKSVIISQKVRFCIFHGSSITDSVVTVLSFARVEPLQYDDRGTKRPVTNGSLPSSRCISSLSHARQAEGNYVSRKVSLNGCPFPSRCSQEDSLSPSPHSFYSSFHFLLFYEGLSGLSNHPMYCGALRSLFKSRSGADCIVSRPCPKFLKP